MTSTVGYNVWPLGIKSTMADFNDGGASPKAPKDASRSAAPREPRISIVIPIYNEQAILHAAVVDLRERLKP